MSLYLIPVTTAHPLLDQVAGLGQIIDYPIGAPLRDLETRGDVPQSDLRIVGNEEKRLAVAGEE
jgi:hypothetical protein